MGEINVKSQNETLRVTPTPSTPPPSHSHCHKHPIMANSPPSSSSSPICNNHIHQNQESVVEPTDQFFMMHLPTPPCCHLNSLCSPVTNPMKRRSPPSFSGQPCAKKLFFDQEDLSLHGFSAFTVPINLKPLVNKRRSSVPVLRRCVSDPYQPPAPPENSSPQARSSGLPPLPPKYRRSVSDLTPEKAPTSSCLNFEETAASDSVKLRRMKERLKEMKQWCDELMKDGEEEKKDGREEKCEVVGEEDDKVHATIAEEDDKIPPVAEENEKLSPQNDLGEEESEEAVSVEWAEQCVSLLFRCPCGKGYEVLLSENNCYYKLV